MNCIEIPNEYIGKDNLNSKRPILYENSILISPRKKEKALKSITFEDVICLNIAYEGIQAFSKLIEEAF